MVRLSIMLRLEILGVWCYKQLYNIFHFFTPLRMATLLFQREKVYNTPSMRRFLTRTWLA